MTGTDIRYKYLLLNMLFFIFFQLLSFGYLILLISTSPFPIFCTLLNDYTAFSDYTASKTSYLKHFHYDGFPYAFGMCRAPSKRNGSDIISSEKCHYIPSDILVMPSPSQRLVYKNTVSKKGRAL